MNPIYGTLFRQLEQSIRTIQHAKQRIHENNAPLICPLPINQKLYTITPQNIEQFEEWVNLFTALRYLQYVQQKNKRIPNQTLIYQQLTKINTMLMKRNLTYPECEAECKELHTCIRETINSYQHYPKLKEVSV